MMIDTTTNEETVVSYFNEDDGVLSFRLNDCLKVLVEANLNETVAIDVYPVGNARHPDRHYGVFTIPLAEIIGKTAELQLPEAKSGQPIELRLDKKPQTINWAGEYNEPNEVTVSIKLVNSNFSSTARGYLGETYSLNEIPSTKETTLESAVWFLTWKCNYKCDYCWEVQRIAKGELKAEPFKDYKLWVKAWNKLKPKILDISGGEPFLQPSFINLLNELDDDIKLAITTNLSFSVSEFVQKVDPKKFISMTLSYHPTQRMTLDAFVGRALLLKNRGFGPLTVNFVSWPEQLWLAEELKDRFESLGLRFHLDPYAATPDYPYTFSEKELGYIKSFTGQDRSHFFNSSEKFSVVCNGGQTHLSVQPNGDAYRCISDQPNGIGPVGNILDQKFTLQSKRTKCDIAHQCHGCDRDKISFFRLKDLDHELIAVSK